MLRPTVAAAAALLLASVGADWWEAPPGSEAGALIIETRAHAALPWLVVDTLGKIPPTWRVLVYHHADNAAFVRTALAGWAAGPSPRVALVQHDDRLVRADPGSNDFVNALLTSRAWWRSLPWDRFLLLQTDAVLCRSDWELLRELLAYDYAGAPWGGPYAVIAESAGGGGGNGGLSWRSRPAALTVLDRTRMPPGANEDWFFSKEMGRRPDLRLAPPALCCRLAVETHLCAPEGAPLGVHAAWRWLPPEDWRRLADAANGTCPVAGVLKELQTALPRDHVWVRLLVAALAGGAASALGLITRPRWGPAVAACVPQAGRAACRSGGYGSRHICGLVATCRRFCFRQRHSDWSHRKAARYGIVSAANGSDEGS
jgi:hypothetical protein